MKKVLLTNDVKSLMTGKGSFLDRVDIKVFSAATTTGLLKIHAREKADLIVTQLNTPGIDSEEFFDSVRKSGELRTVSTILICNDTLDQRERCRRCRVNAVVTLPVDLTLLHIKMRQLLDVPPRMFYRAALAVAIQGRFRNRPLPFWTENISASGMLIRAEEPLAKGEGVYFSFFLPDGAHVSGYGEIIRAVRPSDKRDAILYGIRFTNVEPGVRASIDETIHKKLHLQRSPGSRPTHGIDGPGQEN